MPECSLNVLSPTQFPGLAELEAFIWDATNGLQVLGDLAGGSLNSSARAVSADGSTVVGWGASGSGQEAFIWDARNGPLRAYLSEHLLSVVQKTLLVFPIPVPQIVPVQHEAADTLGYLRQQGTGQNEKALQGVGPRVLLSTAR